MAKMASTEENDNHDDIMIDTKLLKFTGLYQILNSRGVPKAFGYNVLRLVTASQIVLYLLTTLAYLSNVYYCADDIFRVTNYFLLIGVYLLGCVKLNCLLKNADRLWDCVQRTSVKYFSYDYHDGRIVEKGRSRSKLFSFMFLCLWLTVVVSWLFSPFLSRNYKMEVKYKDHVYHYRYNILNLVYPVTDRFYNDNYLSYYVLEFIISITWGHSTLIFDVLTISMCVTLSYQLKVIANSYSTFGNDVNRSSTSIFENTPRNKTKTCEYKKTLNDFKILIMDQQKVVENLRNICHIFKPAIVIQIGTDSFEIILLSQVTIMNYFNGLSLLSSINIKLIFTLMTNILHLFFVCYFFNDTNDQKDSLNFAMYSSGWTERDIHFKKLLLYGMTMNSADNQRLQVTNKRKVNLELFSNVMQTTYSILSVLSKQYTKK